jgi:hypothetical protein
MKSVVVCGSKKYHKEIALFCAQLSKLGVLVFEPSFNDPPFDEDTKLNSDFVTALLNNSFPNPA